MGYLLGWLTEIKMRWRDTGWVSFYNILSLCFCNFFSHDLSSFI